MKNSKKGSPQPTDFSLARTQRTLPIALLRAREAVMDRMRPMLHEHDITEQQWRVIRVLHEEGPLDASSIAEQACILAPSLTRIIKTLEKRELIATSRDPADARRLMADLSAKGQDLIASITVQASNIYAGIEADMGAERIEGLLNELEFLLSRLGARGN
ncbi:homoprotocatechuate degradation operon regulator HpaR [Celeribacter sp.]|uniref:homoprotocatechuate degradation operon regulator HpaR n=1 Tax=Celeribacter sp. TaxID=1890673 RepID=UPI003A92F101